MPGGRIFVRQWQPAETSNLTTPIILLHDSLGSVGQWRNFPEEPAIRTNRRVIAYDRLGFGHSSARTIRPSINFINEEAADVFPILIETLGIDRCVLFGHSVGGSMAIAAAGLNRNKVEAVITAAAQAFVEERTINGIQAARIAFQDPARFEKLQKWLGEKARWILNAWTEVWLSPQFASWSLGPFLSKVYCPVLTIHGDRDDFGSSEFPRRIAANVNAPNNWPS